MTVNPYTLNHLYQNGIIDYVPSDLMTPSPVGISYPMTNPYLDMAQQGELYQSHGTSADSFHSSFTPAYTPTYPTNVSAGSNAAYTSGIGYGNSNLGYNGIGSSVHIGSNSNAGGINAFSGYRVGINNNNSIPGAFGMNGNIGSQSNAGGMNAFNGVGIGSLSNTGGANAFGGFADTQNSIANGFNKTASLIDRTPKFLLGILAATIGFIGISNAFKRGKNPVKNTTNTSFLSKLNPCNWFKKNK